MSSSGKGITSSPGILWRPNLRPYACALLVNSLSPTTVTLKFMKRGCPQSSLSITKRIGLRGHNIYSESTFMTMKKYWQVVWDSRWIQTFFYKNLCSTKNAISNYKLDEKFFPLGHKILISPENIKLRRHHKSRGMLKSAAVKQMQSGKSPGTDGLHLINKVNYGWRKREAFR